MIKKFEELARVSISFTKRAPSKKCRYPSVVYLPKFHMYSKHMDIRPKEFTDDFGERLGSDKRLRPVKEFETIQDYDDKFGLDNFRLYIY